MTGILNLSGLHEIDPKELEFEYHVKAEPAAISRLCQHCGEFNLVQKHVTRFFDLAVGKGEVQDGASQPILAPST